MEPFMRFLQKPAKIPNDLLTDIYREDLIRTTIDAARGAKQAILHIHLSTSDIFRKVVFNTTEQDLIDLAVRCIKLIRELTKDSYDPEIRKTKWTLEFTPENFQDTTLDYALRICEAVKAAWQPSRDDQIIFNLTATVEVAMPNVFADQIEYFCDHITDREKVCVSVHNHNDRGSAVATAEMAQLAGAERVEGCLFGNGERTGNVDLVILAMNLYTQGIDPGIDFGNINDVVKMVEDLTKIPVHLRAPYAGRYTFCTFSGSHQDAIRKGYKARAAQEKALQYSPKWAMPYLPMDPVDVGREHEAVIRLNSQSGKGGIGWYVKEVFGMEMPRELEIAFTKIVKTYATATGLEMTHGMIEKLFRSQYMLPEDASLQILDCKVSESGGSNNRVKLHSRIAIDGAAYNIRGSGSDPVASALDGAAQMGLVTKPIHHQVQQVATDQDEPGPIQTATFVKLHTDAKETSWGVSIHENATWSSLQAVSTKPSFGKGSL